MMFALWILSALSIDDPHPAIQVHKIWDRAPHNAFTDLVRWEGRLYCCFREANGHVPRKSGDDGRIRILVSDDGEPFQSFDVLEKEGVDLRDPHFSITEENLQVILGGSHYREGKFVKRDPMRAVLPSGASEFLEPEILKIDEKIASDVDWLWRVTWNRAVGVGYGVVYQARGDEWDVHLVKTSDGLHYAHHATLPLDGRPNEATIRFEPGGQMVMVLRREGGDRLGVIGRSNGGVEWTFHSLPLRLGGPDILLTADGGWILGTRSYSKEGASTILGRVTFGGEFEEKVRLPSGGDTSYPGMLWDDEDLLVSYYSSHEGRTSIYLARVPLSALN